MAALNSDISGCYFSRVLRTTTVFKISLQQTKGTSLWKTIWEPGLKFPLFTCTLCPIYYRCTPNDFDLEGCIQIALWLSPFLDIFVWEDDILHSALTAAGTNELLTLIQIDMKTVGMENVVPTAVDVSISAFKTCTFVGERWELALPRWTLSLVHNALWMIIILDYDVFNSLLPWPRPIDRPGYCGQKQRHCKTNGWSLNALVPAVMKD